MLYGRLLVSRTCTEQILYPAHFYPIATWMGESAASLALLLLPAHCGAGPDTLMRIFSYWPPVSSLDLVETHVFQIFWKTKKKKKEKKKDL